MSEPRVSNEELEAVAIDVRNCAFGWETSARLLGNVQAIEISTLCTAYLDARARIVELEGEKEVFKNHIEAMAAVMREDGHSVAFDGSNLFIDCSFQERES